MPKRHDNEKKEREKMHTQRRYATCPQDKSKKKKRRKKYSPCPRKKCTRREIDHTKEFIHYPPKIFHTLAALDQIVSLVSAWIMFLT